MSTDEPQKPKVPQNPEIIVDEDWKTRVQAEREPETSQADPTPTPEKQTEKPAAVDESQIPEASFSLLATTLATQTLVALGQSPLPGEEKVTISLPFAKHCIDTLDILEQKTKGNLTPSESQLLTQVLYQLRMLYVSVKNQQAS
jgi:hypothetical protein